MHDKATDDGTYAKPAWMGGLVDKPKMDASYVVPLYCDWFYFNTGLSVGTVDVDLVLSATQCLNIVCGT